MSNSKLENKVRNSIRREISTNEYNFKYRAEAQRRYRDTEKGKAAIKRQNDKVIAKNKVFSSLTSLLQDMMRKNS